MFKSAKVTELEARVSELEAENIELKNQDEARVSSETKVAELEGKVAALEEANSEIEGLNATIADQKTIIAKKDEEIAGLKSDCEITTEKIDLAAATKLATMGHGAPLDTTGTGITSKDSIKNLTGLEKVTAAFKAQSAK